MFSVEVISRVPTFRSDLESIVPYRPGKPIEETARELNLSQIVKLASNESPVPPFPEVRAAIAAAAEGVHRYPDNEKFLLRTAVSDFIGAPSDKLWFGSGSSELMLMTAIAVGGPGSSAVYAWPSFGLYRIASRVAMAEGIEVPLDEDHSHDLERMRSAIRDDTTVVYVCNPNNPTGTHVAAQDLVDFIDSIPDRILVVVDEAYYEYAQAADYYTARSLALERPNVVVAHTFSKVYGLAGLRVGYMIGDDAIFRQTRRVQLPFTVNSIAQVAAIEALRHQDRVADRVQRNAEGLKLFYEELSERGIDFAHSQANFVYMKAGADSAALKDALLPLGVIIRPMDGAWSRVSIGTEAENARFFEALDEV